MFANSFSRDDPEDEDIGNDKRLRERDTSDISVRRDITSDHAVKMIEDSTAKERHDAQKYNGTGALQQEDQVVIDLKATILTLREDLLLAKTEAVIAKEKANDVTWKNKELTQDHKYNLRKIETLEKDIAELNKFLGKVKGDVKYYREMWESEESYTQNFRKMEEKLDRLRRESDTLRRQSVNSNNEHEQLRRTTEEMERRLRGANDRNDAYLRDLGKLREKALQLETTNRRLENLSSVADVSNCPSNLDSLELKLKEAVSRNEQLVKALAEANEKVTRLDYANRRLQTEKEAMCDELERTRGSQSTRGGMAKVKLESTH
ncbi:MAG: hypothetical protein SGBAC_013378 [Bacillariaceae sp.]